MASAGSAEKQQTNRDEDEDADSDTELDDGGTNNETEDDDAVTAEAGDETGVNGGLEETAVMDGFDLVRGGGGGHNAETTTVDDDTADALAVIGEVLAGKLVVLVTACRAVTATADPVSARFALGV